MSDDTVPDAEKSIYVVSFLLRDASCAPQIYVCIDVCMLCMCACVHALCMNLVCVHICVPMNVCMHACMHGYLYVCVLMCSHTMNVIGHEVVPSSRAASGKQILRARN